MKARSRRGMLAETARRVYTYGCYAASAYEGLAEKALNLAQLNRSANPCCVCWVGWLLRGLGNTPSARVLVWNVTLRGIITRANESHSDVRGC